MIPATPPQAGRLPVRQIIHTVGPTDGSEPVLRSCYERCLSCARASGCRSIVRARATPKRSARPITGAQAFPCIATGVYGYDNESAARVALEATRAFLARDGNAAAFDSIVFCAFLEKDKIIYDALLPAYFP